MSEKQATILLVEDEIPLQMGITELLDISYLEYEVDIFVASNGLEGLEMMRTITPTLIISDIMMPKMDGYTFLQRVRENSQWVHIPFIFLTARGKKQDIRTGKRSGAELYLTKPFDTTKLVELVKTQLKRSYQLQDARQKHVQKFKDSVLQLFNHELRTPLTYVLAYYEMLSDSLSVYEDGENVGAYLRGIQTGCDRLAHLVDDLILVMDIRTGVAAQVYEQEGEVIADVGELWREATTAVSTRKRITIHEEIESNLPPVWGMREQLLMVFKHLLENAIKFTLPKQQEAEPQIWVRATAVGQHIHLQITDNGVGLPERVHRQIFDLFFQYDREQYEQQGAGAGLAIVQGLVEIHGGWIELESKEGEGSTFHVFLPQATSKESHVPVSVSERTIQGQLPKANILIVEDDFYLLEGLRELLELYDGPYALEVETALDGMQALDVIRRIQPDLIVSDITMPKLDGYGLLKEVRENPDWTHIPVIFLTAKGDSKDIHHGLLSGVEEYIPKPYDGDELMDMITIQLQRHFQRLEATAEDFDLLKQSVLNLLQTDFRTPLATVSNYSSSLALELEQTQTTGELKQSLAGIQEGSLRISELVEDFITLAEVKTGEADHALKLRGAPMPNVGMLLHQALQGQEIAQKTAALTVVAQANQTLPPVWIDYERLYVAFARLLSVVADLCQYGQGQTMWLTAVADESHVYLHVRHDSQAVADDLVMLIERLFKYDDEQIVEKSFFGAALCLVNGVVKVHHGRVDLTTTDQPHDTFTITLPIYNRDDHLYDENNDDFMLGDRLF